MVLDRLLDGVGGKDHHDLLGWDIGRTWRASRTRSTTMDINIRNF